MATVGEVVVTARAGANERRRVEASYAVSAITETQLRLQAPISTAEAFKAIPGFWVEASGGEASNNVRSRGIPTDGYSSVTIQEDGLTIQHDGGLGWLNADQSFRLDETIGRVEAVRGGPSSIFASNAPGGVVNFITKQAGPTPEGIIKVQAGDYGMYRADFFYGAPLGEDWGLTIGG
ncbi:MAG: TonB-dependent receptor plug domain-containing protein, partial [Phenylobacterium sp.]|nr:TonB-dependent receptor plug domain-containing protein [Phenylobacterium sp.]